MVESIIFCIISVSIVSAIFFAWLFYQKARNKERMYLLEKGEKLEDIFLIQNQNQFKFVFPWLRLGVVTLGISLSFFAIAYLIKNLENDLELFKGFLITCIIGTCLGLSFIVNHLIRNR